MARRPRVFIGPMTGRIYASTDYNEQDGILTTKTKVDVTEDVEQAMVMVARGSVPRARLNNPDEHWDLPLGRAVPVMQEDLLVLLTIADKVVDRAGPLIDEWTVAVERIKKVLG